MIRADRERALTPSFPDPMKVFRLREVGEKMPQRAAGRERAYQSRSSGGTSDQKVRMRCSEASMRPALRPPS